MKRIEEEQYKMQKCRKINDPLDTFVSEKIAFFLAKPFIKHRVSPNIVTMFSLILGILGSVCIVFKPWWLTLIGILIIFLSYCYDCADGMVARATGRGSLYGRCFDGFADGLVYGAIYICVCIRLFNEPIPFTQTNWGHWILLVAVPVGAYFHGSQARIADYYKNVYMYLSGNSHCELSRSKNIKKQVEEFPKHSFKHMICNSYAGYTASQERSTPQFQKLQQKIEENGGVIPSKVSEIWLSGTNRTIIFTNALVFNFRTYILFALLLCEALIPVPGLCFWIFPINIFVFEIIKIILIVKYEKLAKLCLEKGFN